MCDFYPLQPEGIGVETSFKSPCPRLDPFTLWKKTQERRLGLCRRDVNGGENRRAILAAGAANSGAPPEMSLSLLSGRRSPERPGAVKSAPLLGAAKRPLESEDRSEMIATKGKARRKAVPPEWPHRAPPLTRRNQYSPPHRANTG